MKRFVAIDSLFSVRSGDFHATDKELDPGAVPLVSCGDVNHGLVGFFDIPKVKQYRDAITVAYNGQPMTAKYRPYAFGAKDDIGILEPLVPMSREPSSMSRQCSMPEDGGIRMGVNASRLNCKPLR